MFLAGSSPPAAHWLEWSRNHFTKACAASTALLLWDFFLYTTKWVELDHTRFCEPMIGTGATPHCRVAIFCSVEACQTPFQLNAVLPFCSAMKSASWPTLRGL